MVHTQPLFCLCGISRKICDDIDIFRQRHLHLEDWPCHNVLTLAKLTMANPLYLAENRSPALTAMSKPYREIMISSTVTGSGTEVWVLGSRFSGFSERPVLLQNNTVSCSPTDRHVAWCCRKVTETYRSSGKSCRTMWYWMIRTRMSHAGGGHR